MAGFVYLIHLDAPYGLLGGKRVQHYIGYSRDPEARLEEHRAGRGSRLLQYVASAGINFDIVRKWRGGRKLERELKDKKRAWTLCPICSQMHHKPLSNTKSKTLQYGD